MSLLNITCPRCGYSKSIEEQQIPAAANIQCPKCQHSFTLAPAAATPSPPAAPDAAPLLPPEEASEPASAPPPESADAGKSAPTPPTKFCSTCGEKIHRRAEICPKCGVRVAAPPQALSKLALLLITFFLGGIGGHKFYQKKYLLGTLYLLFFWTYIPTLASWVEFIIYACKSEPELQEMFPETNSGALVFVFIAFIGIAIIGILAAIAIPQFAAYRNKARDAAASSELKSCKTRAESYFADHNTYPIAPGQLQCPTSEGVALYYLSFGPEEYQLVSFHDQGQKAFLLNSGDGGIEENPKEEIENEIKENYGAAQLGGAFHFIVDAPGKKDLAL